MAKVLFCNFDPMKSEVLLPQMFHILSTNMGKIAPTGSNCEEDMKIWLSYMTSEQIKETQILLMYVGEALAGYFQYRISKNIMLIEEVEIAQEYQRTFLFYHLLKYVSNIIPKNIEYAEAYINKHNFNSQRIARKLGMQIVGENPNGHSFRYRGELSSFKKILR